MTWMRPEFPAPRAGRLAGAALAALLGGCAAGPSYHRPEAAAPAAFKEAAGWKAAAPAEAAPRGPWWEAFGDPELNELENRVATANQSLRQAEASYEESRQAARADRATFLPSLSAVGSAERARSPVSKTNPTPAAATTYSAFLQAAWEPDLWGRIRRTTEAGVAAAQASAADLALTRLSLQTALARDYIALRTLDERRHLLANAVEAYGRTLTISRNRYNAGVAARSDVVSAQTQLDNARAQLLDVGVQRAQLEHALAVLTGRAPAEVTLAPRASLDLTMPVVPPALPSDLLERRPDVAEAERSAAAANARVGIQVGAWFPSISLSGEDGYEGSPLRNLLTAPNRFWSLGGQAAETLLDWGQRSAGVRGARAAYDASVAGYRQTVLAALQDVEDNLASLRILAEEAQVEDAAVGEAAEAARIALNEYNAGTVDYTTVANAQVAELNSRIAALNILSSRLSASVGLITALGGGWTTADLPDAHGVFSGPRHD
ncbi:MAG TPA: efflux transporter outer membrane subunit [Opitutaceae bacterium]|nr:efflux transporter outer membrane subunit [Opitutaceae bacterium]